MWGTDSRLSTLGRRHPQRGPRDRVQEDPFQGMDSRFFFASRSAQGAGLETPEADC